jgi:hypothetical protein
MTCNRYKFIRISAYPDPRLKSAMGRRGQTIEAMEEILDSWFLAANLIRENDIPPFMETVTA